MSLADKLSFKDFVEEVEKTVRERVDGEVRVEEVHKNNGVKLQGLVIVEKDINTSPTLYLDGYYRDLYLKTNFEFTVERILQDYEKNKITKVFEFSSLKDEEYVKPLIRMRLINYEKNKDMLKETPHRQFMDMAVIYEIEINVPEIGKGSIIVRNKILDLWCYTEQDLYNFAMENTKDDYSINNMSEILKELAGLDECGDCGISMQVISNKSKTFGATAMLHKDVLMKAKEVVGTEKIIIIPSSVHELIVVGYTDEEDTERFNSMVNCVNENEVEQVDVLSNHIYVFDGNEIESCN